MLEGVGDPLYQLVAGLHRETLLVLRELLTNRLGAAQNAGELLLLRGRQFRTPLDLGQEGPSLLFQIFHVLQGVVPRLVVEVHLRVFPVLGVDRLDRLVEEPLHAFHQILLKAQFGGVTVVGLVLGVVQIRGGRRDVGLFLVFHLNILLQQ